MRNITDVVWEAKRLVASFPVSRERGKALWDEEDPEAWEEATKNRAIILGLLEEFAGSEEDKLWLAVLALLLTPEDIANLREAMTEARETGFNPVARWLNKTAPRYPEAEEAVRHWQEGEE